MTKRLILAGLMLLVGLVGQPAFAAETVSPTNAYSVDVSGTVTLGGTYQTVQAANTARRNCTVQNPSSASEALLVKVGTMAQPYALAAGQSLSTLNGTVNATDAITVTATTTGHAFAGSCQ